MTQADINIVHKRINDLTEHVHSIDTNMQVGFAEIKTEINKPRASGVVGFLKESTAGDKFIFLIAILIVGSMVFDRMTFRTALENVVKPLTGIKTPARVDML